MISYYIIELNKGFNDVNHKASDLKILFIFTWDANEKFGPGDLFFPPTVPGPPPGPPPALLGAFWAAPFLFLRLLVGLADSAMQRTKF